MVAVAGCGQSGDDGRNDGGNPGSDPAGGRFGLTVGFPPIPNPKDPPPQPANWRLAYPPGSTDPALLRQQPPSPVIAVGSLGARELAVSYSVPPPSGHALKPVALTITTDNTSEDRYLPRSKSFRLNERLRGRARIPFGLGPPPTEVRAKTAARNNLLSDSIVVRLVRE
jgi:hypothetical protein